MAMPVFKILDVYLMAMHSGADPALGKDTVDNEYQPPLNFTIGDTIVWHSSKLERTFTEKRISRA